MKVLGVCSNRQRPSVQNSHSKGHQYWRRDVWHAKSLTHEGRTICNRDLKDWLIIGEIEIDNHFCERCLRALKINVLERKGEV